jgi:hypothetical protein
MTPARVAVVILTLVLASLLAVGVWGERPQPRLADDEYIAIALSAPEVFHPSGAQSGRSVSARVDHDAAPVTVEVTSDGSRFRVLIDPRTNRITQVTRLN